MRYGYFRIYILLRREGWVVNHKRVDRLYRNDGLSLRLKKPSRNVGAANRERWRRDYNESRPHTALG
jgi:putative transposase